MYEVIFNGQQLYALAGTHFQAVEEMKKQNPFIMQLLEGKGAVNLTGEEHEILTAFFRLYMKADNMEREHIYFRGHTDGFAYLQRIGALKNE